MHHGTFMRIHPSPKVMADCFQTQKLTWCPYPICTIFGGCIKRMHMFIWICQISLNKINDDVQTWLEKNYAYRSSNPGAERVNAKRQYILHRKWTLTCILCTRQKSDKLDKGIMLIFVSEIIDHYFWRRVYCGTAKTTVNDAAMWTTCQL